MKEGRKAARLRRREREIIETVRKKHETRREEFAEQIVLKAGIVTTIEAQILARYFTQK